MRRLSTAALDATAAAAAVPASAAVSSSLTAFNDSLETRRPISTVYSRGGFGDTECVLKVYKMLSYRRETALHCVL